VKAFPKSLYKDVEHVESSIVYSSLRLNFDVDNCKFDAFDSGGNRATIGDWKRINDYGVSAREVNLLYRRGRDGHV